MSDDRVRLEYEQTLQLVSSLTEIRFKLLAFVPTIAAFGVGFFGKPRPAGELLAVGLIGLVATLGIFLYELRNSQIYTGAVRRARKLEETMEMPGGPGHLLTGRRGQTANRGVAIVYGAALGGWMYLFAWGALRALDIANARNAGAAIAVVFGVLVFADAEWIDRRTANTEASRPAAAAAG